MKDFQWIYDRACELKGGASAVKALLPKVKSDKQLKAVSDAEYLSLIGLRIFRAGLKHSLVDAKWPTFEKVFAGFNPAYVAALSDEALEEHMRQPGLIAHWGKMKALRHNAAWLLELDRQGSATGHGFGEWIVAWPKDDVVGLWLAMKKQGAQLGGRSAASVLRMAGKDTFQLSSDVMVQLRAMGVSDKAEAPTAKRDLERIQDAFNTWSAQGGGMPLAHISRMLSFT